VISLCQIDHELQNFNFIKTSRRLLKALLMVIFPEAGSVSNFATRLEELYDLCSSKMI